MKNGSHNEKCKFSFTFETKKGKKENNPTPTASLPAKSRKVTDFICRACNFRFIACAIHPLLLYFFCVFVHMRIQATT